MEVWNQSVKNQMKGLTQYFDLVVPVSWYLTKWNLIFFLLFWSRCLEWKLQNVSYLPQIKTDGTNIIILVQRVISFILWVINFRVDPFTFVVRIVNLFGFPFTLKEGKKEITIRLTVTLLFLLAFKRFLFCCSVTTIFHLN